MGTHFSRRDALRYGTGALLIGTAGCTGGESDAAGATTDEATGGTADGTEPETGTGTAADTETTTATVDTGGTWATKQHDNANTGHNADAVGPVDSATSAWTGGLDDSGSGPAVVDGTIYVGNASGEVRAFDAETGAEEWTFEVEGSPDNVDASPAVADGTVVVPARDGTLYALNAADGTVRWSESDLVGGGTLITQQGSATIADGTVYVGSIDKNFFGLDLETGDRELTVNDWPTDNDEETIQTAPAVVDGTAYVGADSGYVFAIDVDSGSVVWHRTIDEPDSVLTAPAVADDTVYAANVGQGKTPVLTAFDAATGSVEWSYEVGDGDTRVFGSPAVAFDGVFVGGNDSVLRAVEQSDGTERWTVEFDGAIYASVTADAERVYAGSYDGEAKAIDPDTGDVIWTNTEVQGFVDAGPTVVDGALYLTADVGDLVALVPAEATTTTDS
jgi:outer membrane protein assembly factor BamB